MIDADLKKLEQLAKELEGTDLPLEESLKKFNEGVELVRKCSKSMNEAELKIKEILEKDNGTFSEKALDDSK
ncbi:MAG: exodeoxyribonuclease VII small subunit [Proteobacteria bacterium]|nr:exodeoxyribonuclease VII small subunit [Pseudomonadota bacterium]